MIAIYFMYEFDLAVTGTFFGEDNIESPRCRRIPHKKHTLNISKMDRLQIYNKRNLLYFPNFIYNI